MTRSISKDRVFVSSIVPFFAFCVLTEGCGEDASPATASGAQSAGTTSSSTMAQGGANSIGNNAQAGNASAGGSATMNAQGIAGSGTGQGQGAVGNTNLGVAGQMGSGGSGAMGGAGATPMANAGASGSNSPMGAAGASMGAGGASGMGGMNAMGGSGMGGQMSAGGAGGMGGMGNQTAPTSICPDNPGTAPSGQLQATLIEGVEPPDYDYHLYEGPVWIDGALYFSDINPNPWDSVIRKYVPGSNMATDFLVGAGSNGLAVDANGVMYSATARLKEISSYDLNTAMQMTAVSGSFNSPNDLAIASDGTIYFSDPQQGELPAGGQPEVVHVVKDGADAVFDEALQSPNGLILSPDEDYLYVGGGGYNGYLVRFALVDGLAGEMEELMTNLQVPDGLTKDCAGNIYIAMHEEQQIWVVSPEGDQIATIGLGAAANGQTVNPTNVAFGGEDRKTLFITGTYSLWQLPMDIAGYPY